MAHRRFLHGDDVAFHGPIACCDCVGLRLGEITRGSRWRSDRRVSGDRDLRRECRDIGGERDGHRDLNFGDPRGSQIGKAEFANVGGGRCDERDFVLEAFKRRSVLQLICREGQIDGLRHIDILREVAHRDAVIVVVLEVLHHGPERGRFQTDRRVFHIRHAVKGKHDNPASACLLHRLDEVLARGAIGHRERGHIKGMVHRRPVWALMPSAPKQIAILQQPRDNRPHHLVDRPAYRRHVWPAIRHDLVLHPQIILQTPAMPVGVIPNLQTIRVHRIHLPVGEIPILARLERIEVAHINRSAKSERLENRCHHGRVTRGSIIKSQYDKPVRDRLQQNSFGIRVRSLPGDQGREAQCDCGEEWKS